MAAFDDVDKSICILIADDYALTRDLVRSILKQLGFLNVVTAEDGRKALDKIRNEQIDFVICDWNMPEMSGFEVLRAVRADANIKNIPFLMLTAEAYKENVEAALKAGVSDYIVKPFSAQVLTDKLEGLMRKK